MNDVSKTIPHSFQRVTEFRELSPGVWFPYRIEALDYDGESVKRGNPVVRGSEEYVAVKVKLNPDHPQSFFSSLEFPAESVVYDVRDDKIVKTTFNRPPPTAGLARNVFVWLLLAAIAVALALVIRQARRRVAA